MSSGFRSTGRTRVTNDTNVTNVTNVTNTELHTQVAQNASGTRTTQVAQPVEVIDRKQFQRTAALSNTSVANTPVSSVASVASVTSVASTSSTASDSSSVTEQILEQVTHDVTITQAAQQFHLPRTFVEQIIDHAERTGRINVMRLRDENGCSTGVCDPNPDSLICAGCPLALAGGANRTTITRRIRERLANQLTHAFHHE